MAPRSSNPAPRTVRAGTADAAVARARGVCVVMVADCLPVLFASRDGRRIGAAHAGWRGLAAGVLENTVAALDVPAAELTAWLGPGDLAQAFRGGRGSARRPSSAPMPAQPTTSRRTRAAAGRRTSSALARRRLAALGVTDVTAATWCTFADRERFFSHRRDGQGRPHGGARLA